MCRISYMPLQQAWELDANEPKWCIWNVQKNASSEKKPDGIVLIHFECNFFLRGNTIPLNFINKISIPDERFYCLCVNLLSFVAIVAEIVRINNVPENRARFTSFASSSSPLSLFLKPYKNQHNRNVTGSFASMENVQKNSSQRQKMGGKDVVWMWITISCPSFVNEPRKSWLIVFLCK